MKGVKIIFGEAEGVLTSTCKGTKKKKKTVIYYYSLKVLIHFVLMECPIFTHIAFISGDLAGGSECLSVS